MEHSVKSQRLIRVSYSKGMHTISMRLFFEFVFRPQVLRHLVLILEITSWIWKHATILECWSSKVQNIFRDRSRRLHRTSGIALAEGRCGYRNTTRREEI